MIYEVVQKTYIYQINMILTGVYLDQFRYLFIFLLRISPWSYAASQYYRPFITMVFVAKTEACFYYGKFVINPDLLRAWSIESLRLNETHCLKELWRGLPPRWVHFIVVFPALSVYMSTFSPKNNTRASFSAVRNIDRCFFRGGLIREAIRLSLTKWHLHPKWYMHWAIIPIFLRNYYLILRTV